MRFILGTRGGFFPFIRETAGGGGSSPHGPGPAVGRGEDRCRCLAMISATPREPEPRLVPLLWSSPLALPLLLKLPRPLPLPLLANPVAPAPPPPNKPNKPPVSARRLAAPLLLLPSAALSLSLPSWDVKVVPK